MGSVCTPSFFSIANESIHPSGILPFLRLERAGGSWQSVDCEHIAGGLGSVIFYCLAEGE